MNIRDKKLAIFCIAAILFCALLYLVLFSPNYSSQLIPVGIYKENGNYILMIREERFRYDSAYYGHNTNIKKTKDFLYKIEILNLEKSNTKIEKYGDDWVSNNLSSIFHLKGVDCRLDSNCSEFKRACDGHNKFSSNRGYDRFICGDKLVAISDELKLVEVSKVSSDLLALNRRVSSSGDFILTIEPAVSSKSSLSYLDQESLFRVFSTSSKVLKEYVISFPDCGGDTIELVDFDYHEDTPVLFTQCLYDKKIHGIIGWDNRVDVEFNSFDSMNYNSIQYLDTERMTVLNFTVNNNHELRVESVSYNENLKVKTKYPLIKIDKTLKPVTQ